MYNNSVKSAILGALLMSGTLVTTGIANAAPMALADNDITGFFSLDVQRKFSLFADSERSDLIWYVPKFGGIGLLGDITNPVPRFSASITVPTTGVFAGQPQAFLGGSFDTTPFPGDLALLASEAEGSFEIAPAPALKATTKFLLGGFMSDTGRPDINCISLTATITNPFTGAIMEVEIPSCTVAFDDGSVTDVNTMQSFVALPPTGNTSVSTSIPFQSQLTPTFSTVAATKLGSGESWDDIIITTVDWDLETRAKTRTARINIDWNETITEFSSYFGIHNNACIDVEINTMFSSLIRDGKGIVVEYKLADGTYSREAPNDADFIKAVNAVEKEMKNDLFAEIQTYTTPRLGQVDRTPGNAYYTLRANYEKQLVRIQESRYINWNPGNSIAQARTDMSITCLVGGFGAPVRWNVADPACNALLTQE